MTAILIPYPQGVPTVSSGTPWKFGYCWREGCDNHVWFPPTQADADRHPFDGLGLCKEHIEEMREW